MFTENQPTHITHINNCIANSLKQFQNHQSLPLILSLLYLTKNCQNKVIKNGREFDSGWFLSESLCLINICIYLSSWSMFVGRGTIQWSLQFIHCFELQLLKNSAQTLRVALYQRYSYTQLFVSFIFYFLFFVLWVIFCSEFWPGFLFLMNFLGFVHVIDW